MSHYYSHLVRIVDVGLKYATHLPSTFRWETTAYIDEIARHFFNTLQCHANRVPWTHDSPVRIELSLEALNVMRDPSRATPRGGWIDQ